MVHFSVLDFALSGPRERDGFRVPTETTRFARQLSFEVVTVSLPRPIRHESLLEKADRRVGHPVG